MSGWAGWQRQDEDAVGESTDVGGDGGEGDGGGD